MLQNDADVSSENVWQYEGSAGLYDRWRTIFQRFRQLDLSAAGGH